MNFFVTSTERSERGGLKTLDNRFLHSPSAGWLSRDDKSRELVVLKSIYN